MTSKENLSPARVEGHGKIGSFINNQNYATSPVYKDIIKRVLLGEYSSGRAISLMDFATLQTLNPSEIQYLFSNLFRQHDLETTEDPYFDH